MDEDHSQFLMREVVETLFMIIQAKQVANHHGFGDGDQLKKHPYRQHRLSGRAKLLIQGATDVLAPAC